MIYSVKIDHKPLDKRIKYIFTEHETQNEFYAWADYKWNDTETNGSALKKLYDIFVTPPIEFYIEAESFFGELCIRRSKFNKFDILINNKLKGLITNHKISCDEIDDKALLAMLYVFQNLFRIMKKNLFPLKLCNTKGCRHFADSLIFYFTVTFLYVLKFNHFSKNLFSSSLVAYSLRKFTTFSLESALISKPRPLMTG